MNVVQRAAICKVSMEFSSVSDSYWYCDNDYKVNATGSSAQNRYINLILVYVKNIYYVLM